MRPVDVPQAVLEQDVLPAIAEGIIRYREVRGQVLRLPESTPLPSDSVSPSRPSRFGKQRMAKPVVLLQNWRPTCIGIGNPVRAIKMPDVCQPPIRPLTQPGVLLAYFRPWPNGRSQIE